MIATLITTLFGRLGRCDPQLPRCVMVLPESSIGRFIGDLPFGLWRSPPETDWQCAL